jgi:large subunit ribosomal protein L22
MANAGTGTTPASAPVKATARYVRVAPNKARQVIAHIRGLDVEEARTILRLSPKAVAEQVLKTPDSAIANAENNNSYDAGRLVITEAFVDEGPMLKRFQPRAMGRAYRIRKRTSHITVAVAEKPAAPVRPAAAKAKPDGKKSSGKAAPKSSSKTEKE